VTAWSPAELDRLKVLTAKKLTAVQIASHLNVEFGNRRSRNAVIGKIVRGNGRFGKLFSCRAYLAPTNTKCRQPAKAVPRSRSAALSLGCAGKTGAASSPAAPVGSFHVSCAEGAPAGRANVPDARSGLRAMPDAAAILPLPPDLPPGEILTVSPPCVGFSVPATRPVRFIDAMFADRCLHFVGDRYGPSGPDMPVCGAKRAEVVFDTRYCRRHLADQYQARAVA